MFRWGHGATCALTRFSVRLLLFGATVGELEPTHIISDLLTYRAAQAYRGAALVRFY